MRLNSIFTFSIALLVILTSKVNADEILIDGFSVARQKVGDFECSLCPNSNCAVLDFPIGNSGCVLSTGELWKFFKSQGRNSVRKLTLCLDLDSIDEDSEFSLESVELTIQDPANPNNFLTDVGFGENSLLVKGYATTSFKPEAKLELDLGYDFMAQFNAESAENLRVTFEPGTKAANSNPVLLVQSSTGSFFFNGSNPVMLGGFAIFWIAVFHLLNRFTDPKRATAKVKAESQSGQVKSGVHA